MENSINGASPKEKKRIERMVYTAYMDKGRNHAYDITNAFNKNHIRIIPYEYCNACESESPAIDNKCLICGQATQRMSDNGIMIRGIKMMRFKDATDWYTNATAEDKIRLEGFVTGAKWGLAQKF